MCMVQAFVLNKKKRKIGIIFTLFKCLYFYVERRIENKISLKEWFM